MKLRPESDLTENIQNAEVFLIGDVRDVLYSRAERVVALPNLVHGVGVCGDEDPITTGEGIVVRGRAAKTAPDADAGIKVDYLTSSKSLYSPFLVGWNAEPSFNTQFIAESGISLTQVYQAIFQDIRERKFLQDHKYIFVEMLASFKPEDIFDRALQCPVNEDHVLTTSTEHFAKFFKARIIYNDLINRSASLDSLVPLCVVGIAYLCDSPDQVAAGINERVFYAPPMSAKPGSPDVSSDHAGYEVLSHSHALGWRSEQLPKSSLSRLDELLEHHPDYLVHLDDWSIMRSATVKIYLANETQWDQRSTSYPTSLSHA